MSSTRFTSSKFPWAAITVATRSCAPLIVLDITALVYPTWLLMSPWIIQILVCLSSGMSLRIAIVNDALSCLTAVCLLVCICRPFIRLHYVMKSSSIWLMMCLCVCMCAHAVFLGEWVVLGCYLHANAKAAHLSPIHANWSRWLWLLAPFWQGLLWVGILCLPVDLAPAPHPLQPTAPFGATVRFERSLIEMMAPKALPAPPSPWKLNRKKTNKIQVSLRKCNL